MLVALTMAVAFFFGEKAGGFYGLFAGILLDMYSVSGLPVNAMLLLVLGCVCGLLARLFFSRNFPAALLCCLAYLFVYYGVCLLAFKGGLVRLRKGLFFESKHTGNFLFPCIFRTLVFPLQKAFKGNIRRQTRLKSSFNRFCGLLQRDDYFINRFCGLLYCGNHFYKSEI